VGRSLEGATATSDRHAKSRIGDQTTTLRAEMTEWQQDKTALEKEDGEDREVEA
jgi:hypothetical protein